ncbi:hypothetical protein [Methylocystis bryophila]|uniref:Uncharacterized protein n=1 Tax=Methylocystis bryophila TaxID=655015 RepID=A0A1W6MYN0_9HYPH|nr:hypothetical protein [Methylocystis bryophila]ARN82636.1 hypothetical protein B1812_17785 [Methylocystis bryophila]BDV38851.1 hypothetical protein DSM21852_21040 [Methylocystis bryophila]
MGSCIQAGPYATLFDQLLESDSHSGFVVPWPRRRGKLFPDKNSYWTKYVVAELINTPRDQRGQKAWRAIVPLRRRESLLSFERPERSFVEAWYFPHGVALTATVWFRGDYDPTGLKAAASDFLAQASDVVWSDGHSQHIKLAGMSRACLDLLRNEAFGDIESGFQPDPFCVLTVVSARPEQPRNAAASDRLMLEAAISAVGGNAAASGPAKDSAVISLPKGRLIWRPDKARADRGTTHTLGCLHRNITLATMQVASLLSGVDATLAALEEAKGAMAPRVEPYARRLVEKIKQIHAMGRDTYDQLCLHRQIEPAKGTVNRLAAAIGVGGIQ